MDVSPAGSQARKRRPAVRRSPKVRTSLGLSGSMDRGALQIRQQDATTTGVSDSTALHGLAERSS